MPKIHVSAWALTFSASIVCRHPPCTALWLSALSVSVFSPPFMLNIAPLLRGYPVTLRLLVMNTLTAQQGSSLAPQNRPRCFSSARGSEGFALCDLDPDSRLSSLRPSTTLPPPVPAISTTTVFKKCKHSSSNREGSAPQARAKRRARALERQALTHANSRAKARCIANSRGKARTRELQRELARTRAKSRKKGSREPDHTGPDAGSF